MSSNNKMGSYVQRLMTTILNPEESDEFVKQLAWDELKRINIDIEEFLRKHKINDDSKELEKTIKKQLLQEEKNGDN